MVENRLGLTPATTPEKRWHAVIGGRWNKAIFTPSGIAKRLFGLPRGHEIKIEISADSIAPLRVTHEDFTAWVNDDRLVVEAASNTISSLEKAIMMARKAVDELPETPLVGAGYMLHFTAPSATHALGRYWTTKCDDNLEKASFVVSARAFSRAVSWRDGEINFVVGQKANSDYEVAVIFNRTSAESSDLHKWLKVSAEEIEGQLEAVLSAFYYTGETL